MDTVIVDQSSWGLLRASGDDRARFLQGMFTNDVAGLAAGAWCRAVVLSVKGRVLAVADVLNEGDAYLLVTEAVTADKLKQVLERHAIADDVELERVERAVHRVWDSPEAVWTAPPVLSARAGSSAEAIEIRRVEAGLPRYGVDVSEENFPFEANLERTLSFSKGCYVGQEVVVRATTRGGAKKKLVGLRAPSGAAPFAAGAVISGAERPDAGIVTSAVVSPVSGAIALGYLHHTLWEPGTRVQVGGQDAEVCGLPFPPL
jgi:folate-binding protein YgfZ